MSLSNLPSDVVHWLSSYFDWQIIINLSRTCKRFYLIYNNQFWQQRLERNFEDQVTFYPRAILNYLASRSNCLRVELEEVKEETGGGGLNILRSNLELYFNKRITFDPKYHIDMILKSKVYLDERRGIYKSSVDDEMIKAVIKDYRREYYELRDRYSKIIKEYFPIKNCLFNYLKAHHTFETIFLDYPRYDSYSSLPALEDLVVEIEKKHPFKPLTLFINKRSEVEFSIFSFDNTLLPNEYQLSPGNRGYQIAYYPNRCYSVCLPPRFYDLVNWLGISDAYVIRLYGIPGYCAADQKIDQETGHYETFTDC